MSIFGLASVGLCHRFTSLIVYFLLALVINGAMCMGAAEVLAFVVVFAAILIEYMRGRSKRSSPRIDQQHQTRRNTPSTEVLLAFRNATGFTTLRKIWIVGYQPRPRGRSCIFALCNNALRSFRVDRIISIATLDGVVLDTWKFLAEQLGVVRQA